MDCRDFSRLIDAYLDGELSEKQSDELVRHMNECGECARQFTERKKLLELSSALSLDVPDYLPDAMQKIREEDERRKAAKKRRIIRFASSAAAVLVIFAVAAFAFFPKNCEAPNDTASMYDYKESQIENMAPQDGMTDEAQQEMPHEQQDGSSDGISSSGGAHRRTVMDAADNCAQLITLDDEKYEGLYFAVSDYFGDIMEYPDGMVLFITDENAEGIKELFLELGIELTAKSGETVAAVH